MKNNKYSQQSVQLINITNDCQQFYQDSNLGFIIK